MNNDKKHGQSGTQVQNSFSGGSADKNIPLSENRANSVKDGVNRRNQPEKTECSCIRDFQTHRQ